MINPVVFGAAAQSSVNANRGAVISPLEWVILIVCSLIMVIGIIPISKLEDRIGFPRMLIVVMVWLLGWTGIAILAGRLVS